MPYKKAVADDASNEQKQERAANKKCAHLFFLLFEKAVLACIVYRAQKNIGAV
jgi:hypothetical protein